MLRRALISLMLVGLLAPAAASASPAALIRDCLKNGRVTGQYSPSDYRQALANLPTDVAEYSDCSDVIRRGQLSTAAGGRGGTGSVGSRPANTLQDPLAGAAPAARTAVAQARRAGASPQSVGGVQIRPGVVHVRASSFIHALPTPLLLVLGALLSIALSVAGRRVWDLVRTRRAG